MADRVRRRVVVRGRVQGVFFRDTMRRRAAQVGVAGWVDQPRATARSRRCSRVSPDAVEQMVRFAREGPRRAEVTGIEVSEEQPEGLEGFSVR